MVKDHIAKGRRARRRITRRAGIAGIAVACMVAAACGSYDGAGPTTPSAPTAALFGESQGPSNTTLRLSLTCMGKDFLSPQADDSWDFEMADARIWIWAGDDLTTVQLYCAPNWQGDRRSYVDIDLALVAGLSWRAQIDLENVAEVPHRCTFEGQELPDRPLRCSLADTTDPYLFDEPSDTGSAAQLTFTLLR